MRVTAAATEQIIRAPRVPGAAVRAELGAAVVGDDVGAAVIVGANDRVGCGVEGEGVVGAAVVGANDAVGYSVGGEGGADGVVVQFSGRITAITITRMKKTNRKQKFKAHKFFVSSLKSSRSLTIP
jgi:hypothetical protein